MIVRCGWGHVDQRKLLHCREGRRMGLILKLCRWCNPPTTRTVWKLGGRIEGHWRSCLGPLQYIIVILHTFSHVWNLHPLGDGCKQHWRGEIACGSLVVSGRGAQRGVVRTPLALTGRKLETSMARLMANHQNSVGSRWSVIQARAMRQRDRQARSTRPFWFWRPDGAAIIWVEWVRRIF